MKNQTPTSLKSPQPLRLYAALLLAFAPLAKADTAQGSLVVSMQVLPSCTSVIDQHGANVKCPSGWVYSVTRTRSSTSAAPQANVQGAQPIVQTTTIRY